ncbi:MAG TPA: protein-disulfide reductase DsbD domain-containing protein [Candidatus Binataceae bacterium]|nr:protein-disulfide reductase DsbD domain-containing protein [Candidatus Binataceae bacterium]
MRSPNPIARNSHHIRLLPTFYRFPRPRLPTPLRSSDSLANNEVVMLESLHPYTIRNLYSYFLNQRCRPSLIVGVSRRWLIVTPIALSLILIATLPAPLRAQSGTISLPDGSDSPPATNAVRAIPTKDGVDLKADDVQAAIRVANPSKVRPGGIVDVTIHFTVAPGWHIYGSPLPAGEDITSTTMSFDQSVAAHQSISMPPPTPMRFDALNETLPVYQGSFAASAQLQLPTGIKPGTQALPGTLSFQECNNTLCKMPRQVSFNLPINVTD